MSRAKRKAHREASLKSNTSRPRNKDGNVKKDHPAVDDKLEHGSRGTKDSERVPVSYPSDGAPKDHEQTDNMTPEPEPEIITLPRPNKPAISTVDSKDNALLARLSSFLPELAQANKELDEERALGKLEERQLENVRDDEEHIEMNLGLGVLEEKPHSDSGSDDDDGGDDGDKASDVKRAGQADEKGEDRVGKPQNKERAGTGGDAHDKEEEKEEQEEQGEEEEEEEEGVLSKLLNPAKRRRVDGGESKGKDVPRLLAHIVDDDVAEASRRRKKPRRTGKEDGAVLGHETWNMEKMKKKTKRGAKKEKMKKKKDKKMKMKRMIEVLS